MDDQSQQDNSQMPKPANSQPVAGVEPIQQSAPIASNQPSQTAPADGHISKGESAKFVVKVDQNLCIGAASCVALAPKIFQLNQENKAYVVDPNGDTEENLKAAAQSCPVNAIILENKESGKQEYP